MRASIHKQSRIRRRKSVITSINLTALIDLFTVLVLFLLFHLAGGADVLPPSDKLKLPSSISETPPEATVVVMITSEDISVEGFKIGKIQEILDQEDMLIPKLKEELDKHANKAKAIGEAMGTELFAGKITIIGDQGTPFRLLEKVMFTCSLAEFSDIDLAVIQKEQAI